MRGQWAEGEVRNQEGKERLTDSKARALITAQVFEGQISEGSQPDIPVLYLASTHVILLPAVWPVSKIKSSSISRETSLSAALCPDVYPVIIAAAPPGPGCQ